LTEYRNIYWQKHPAALAAYHDSIAAHKHDSIVDYDSNIDLLLGFYYYSLIATPPYRIRNYNYLANSYCPPRVWAAWSPLQRSLWIESALDDELRNYEDEIWWINFREKMKIESEVQRLIDDLKREMERAKED
jgi:hypothetical protein